ncbi:hypothetical protein Tco_0858719 [Tanacetum coccineum]|uniref:Retrotransposon gag domain-containing protein n=1 Tax=Tanacetum coccineum TaxID=301880 RepID=A0ABQ5BCX5_9ASTR
MEDENPIRTLGDYSKPNHGGYRNTIKLPVGNNVVPLRSDTIRLVKMDAHSTGIWKECAALFQFSLRDQANNWLKRLPAGSITTWEDLTTVSIGPHDTQYCMDDFEQAYIDYASLRVNEMGGKRFTLNYGPRNFNDAANTWKKKPNINWARSQTFTNPQSGSISVHSSSYQMRLEKALLDFNSNQEKRKLHGPQEHCINQSRRNKGAVIRKKTSHQPTYADTTSVNRHGSKRDFMILEDTTSIIDRCLGEMVFGRLFIDETGLVYNKEEGTVMFKQGNEKIKFKMPHTMEIFKQTRLIGASTDSIPLLAYEENFSNGRTHYYQSLLIRDEYRQDEGDRRGVRNLIRPNKAFHGLWPMEGLVRPGWPILEEWTEIGPLCGLGESDSCLPFHSRARMRSQYKLARNHPCNTECRGDHCRSHMRISLQSFAVLPSGKN